MQSIVEIWENCRELQFFDGVHIMNPHKKIIIIFFKIKSLGNDLPDSSLILAGLTSSNQ